MLQQPPSHATDRQRPFHLGLTGGIGSGKSTVAQLLVAHGAALIDADAISRATTAAGGSALPAIARQFGPDLIGTDGALDRAAMRALVYRDPSARQRLEAIIHPLVGHETQRQTDQATQAGQALLVFDIPLLVESGPRWRARLDRVLVVDCPSETQVQRVMTRDGLPLTQIEAILAVQASRAQRLAAADWVLYNGAETSLVALEAATAQIARNLGL